MKTETEIALERTHDALNDVLTLFVKNHGCDWNCVEKAFAALAGNYSLSNKKLILPCTNAFAQKVVDLADGPVGLISLPKEDNP